MSAAPLLFELGCEELPPAWVNRMADELAQRLTEALDAAGVARGGATVFATPRRLAVLVDAVAAEQPEQTIERRGPAVKAPAKAELNDELAKQFGAESLEALRGQIEERLKSEYALAERFAFPKAPSFQG